MLYFSKRHHQYGKGHLATDVTFSLAEVGLTRIYDDIQLAAILSGQQYDGETTIKINDTMIDLSSDEGCSKWRQQYATFYHEVNGLLKSKTILENITLFYDYTKTDIYDTLKLFELQNHAHTIAEVASFELYMTMVFARVYLKGNELLVVDVDQLDYTKEEFEILGRLIVKISSWMQVIILGKKPLHLPYTRELTIQNGYLSADSGMEYYPLTTSLPPNKSLQTKVFTQMMKEMHQRYSLPYHVLLLLLMISFFLVSVFLSTISMNIEDIQLAMLKRQQQTSFEIKAYAKDNQGTYYQMDDVLTTSQMQTLAQEDSFIYTYRPINTYYANAYLEGIYDEAFTPPYNQYDICELIDETQLGISNMVGNFPTTYQEVMISESLAIKLFNIASQNVVGQQISWYGVPLTISAIYLDENMNDDCLYVLKGFIQQHPLHTMQVFQYGHKHLYEQEKHVLISDFQELNPWALIYNGYRSVYANTLKSNEVIIDIATAKDLGFPYEEIASDDNSSYEEKLQIYFEFIDQMIGKPIKVKADRLDATFDTTYYQESKVIGGTLIPSMDIMFQQTNLKPKVLYFKKGTLQSYLVENYYISKVQYYASDDSQIKATLKKLQEHPYLYAHLKDNLLLKLLIIDMKELGTFFISMYIIFGILNLMLYHLLMRKTLYHNRKALKLIYGFGTSKKQIKREFKKRFLNKMKRYFMISLSISTMILAIYYLIIFIKLSWDGMIFFYLIIPCMIYIIYGIFMMIITKYYLNTFFRRSL